MKISVVVVIVLLFSSIAFADFRQITKSEIIKINPKQIDSLKVKIVQSGFLAVSGPVTTASLILYTPQEGVESRDVFSDSPFSWELAKDDFGNEQVHVEWKRPSGRMEYRIETVVASRAKILPFTKPLASNPEYLKENPQIVFTDEMRRIAYPYENSLEKAAELTKWVSNYVNYDLSLVGKLKPSDWVLENRRGVCVEYANLLSSLMKIAGIPNRYVVGYAYSNVENKLIGHTWVEVLAADGSWIPFDATWLQAGYIDATHIKTANRIDANQTEVLTYFGLGSVSWERNEDDIQILDYRLKNITEIFLETRDVSFDESGYIKAGVQTNSCTITDVAALSCLGKDGRKILNILDEKRQLWHCAQQEIYWFFSAGDISRNFVYTCPITVFDQAGANRETTVRIEGEAKPKEISISGPSTVSINEKFSLVANADGGFVFYSPNITRHADRTWPLSLQKSGTYKFYLYSDGALAAKEVTVVEKKEFEISLSVPKNATVGSSFLAAVIVKNLESRQKQATIRIEFDGVQEQKITFEPNGIKTLFYNLTAKTTRGRITALALSDSVTSYSAFIQIYEKETPKGFLETIFKFFSDIFHAVANFFGSLFRR